MEGRTGATADEEDGDDAEAEKTKIGLCTLKAKLLQAAVRSSLTYPDNTFWPFPDSTFCNALHIAR